MNWSYGVTTVPSRRHTFLPRTLNSLAVAGFDKPRLFIDGAKDASEYASLGLDTTVHYPTIRTAGNWILSLLELYVRNPVGERFAIFQDDLITYRNLRQYLEKCKYPENGYWNLYTFPKNQALADSRLGEGKKGWYESDQLGKGAVALIFSREAVCNLLGQRYLFDRCQDGNRGWKSIDGGIVCAMKIANYREYVHSPSLVQHTGQTGSSMGNKVHPLAPYFLGEDTDALTLLDSDEPAITNLQPSRTVMMKFEEGSYRPPRIVANPED